jgi:phosphoadenosine phosphosulfate reductase
MAPAPPSPPALPKPLQLPLSEADLAAINAYLMPLTPQEVLTWALEHLPGLYQTTAFGLTGCATTDMLSKLTPNPPPLIFVDTLYHFKETLELMEAMRARYGVPVHVYKPEGCETVEDFERKYGTELWKKDEDLYDYAVKVRDHRLSSAFHDD